VPTSAGAPTEVQLPAPPPQENRKGRPDATKPGPSAIRWGCADFSEEGVGVFPDGQVSLIGSHGATSQSVMPAARGFPRAVQCEPVLGERLPSQPRCGGGRDRQHEAPGPMRTWGFLRYQLQSMMWKVFEKILRLFN